MKLHNKKKVSWVKDIEIGKVKEGFICGVKTVRMEGSSYRFTIYDKTGELEAETPVSKSPELTDGIYVVDVGLILKKGVKTGVVKAMRPVEPGKDEYTTLDIYTGLSPEKVAQYTFLCKQAIESVRNHDGMAGNEGYGRLLDLYFTEEEFAVLASKPASVNGAGRYVGGALALVANLTALTKDVSIEMKRLCNGIYGEEIDYPLMLTACLLSMSGVAEYIGEDMKKTPKGLARGYYSLVQSRLDVLFEQAQLSELGRDRLLNTLHCLYPGTGALKSVTLESSICRMVLALYSEVDEVFAYLAESPTEEDKARGYRYSTELRRMFFLRGNDMDGVENTEGGECNERVS